MIHFIVESYDHGYKMYAEVWKWCAARERKSKLYFCVYNPHPNQGQLQSKMKNIIVVAILSLALLQLGSAALTCTDGYYDSGGASTKCTQCWLGYSKCASSNNGTVISAIKGWTTNTAGIPDQYCYGFTDAGSVYRYTYYEASSNTCRPTCKEGCSACLTDYDVCTDCANGYTWNKDFTCLPAVIGLEAAALALLVISLLFLIIGCIYVNKARK